MWQTDTTHFSLTGDTNQTVEAYETAEFLKDGSLKFTNLMKSRNGKETAIPMDGTYTMIGPNLFRLEIAPNPTRPDIRIRLHVSFTISGDSLETVVRGSVFPAKTKYWRVKR